MLAVSSLNAKKSGFNWFKNRMFDLEAKVARQAEDAETQTTIVKRLEVDVKSGKASERELELAKQHHEGKRLVNRVVNVFRTPAVSLHFLQVFSLKCAAKERNGRKTRGGTRERGRSYGKG